MTGLLAAMVPLAPFLAAACGAGAVLLGLAPPARSSTSLVAPPAVDRADVGWLARHRLVWSVLAGVGALTFLGGTAGLVAAPVVAGGVWTVAGRAEPPAHRRRREAVRRDLPHVVGLVATGLRSGADPAEAVTAVCRALPGPAADRLGSVAARLSLGGDPADAWADLARDAELGPLGRTMVRAHRTGAPVVGVVERLADELARAARADVEDQARAVGVKAAVPLGLCLLPAFVLIGIVPLVAGLLGSLAW